MELGEWGRIIENSDNKRSDNKGFTVLNLCEGDVHQT